MSTYLGVTSETRKGKRDHGWVEEWETEKQQSTSDLIRKYQKEKKEKKIGIWKED